MRNDRLRASAITVRCRGFRWHGESLARACDLSGRMGDARFGTAHVHMLVEAGRVLRHAGRCQERRDERHREDVFDGHDFSPAFDRKRLMCALTH